MTTLTLPRVLWHVPQTTVGRDGELLSGCDAFEVQAGQLVHVTGESGAGKSLLLRALCLPHRLAQNGMCCAQISQARLSPGAALIFVPQQAPPLAWLGLRAQLDERALEHTAGWPEDPNLLSGGQRQRLAIWRASRFQPNVLVLDEPGVGLDPGAMRALAEHLQAHRRAGGGLVLVSHQPALLEALGGASRVVQVWDQATRRARRVDGFGRAPRWHRVDAALRLPGLSSVPSAWRPRLFLVLGRVLFHPKFALFFVLVGLMLGSSLGVTMAGLGARWLDPSVLLVRGALPAICWLAPPLALMLSASTFACSALAWSGQQRLLGTQDALEGLGVDTTRAIGQVLVVATIFAACMIQLLLLGCLVVGLRLAAFGLDVQVAWGAQLAVTLRDPRLWSRWGLYPLILGALMAWHVHAPIARASDISRRTLALTLAATMAAVCFESWSAMRQFW